MRRKKLTGSKAGRRQAQLLEERREALLRRLERLDPAVKARTGYRSARRLLNQKFRKASVTARLGILDAAAFMVNVLENVPPL